MGSQAAFTTLNLVPNKHKLRPCIKIQNKKYGENTEKNTEKFAHILKNSYEQGA